MSTYKEHIKHGDASFSFDLFDQYFPIPGEQTCRIHWHEECEWVFVEKGVVSVYIDSVEYLVKENSLICIPGNVLHHMICRESCHYYACIFQLGMLDFQQEDEAEVEFLKPILKQHDWFTMPVVFEEDRVRMLYREIVEEFSKKELGYQLQIKANLLKVIAHLIRTNHVVERETRTDHRLAPIEMIFHYIEEHYGEKLSMQSLADLISYNAQYFTRYFKQHTGETPVDYVNRVRLDKAAEQLINTDKSVLDISLDCGFESCSYFIKRFTKYKSQTPHAYRKMVKNRKVMKHDQLVKHKQG